MVSTLMEHYFAKNHDASFSEYFYQIRRLGTKRAVILSVLWGPAYCYVSSKIITGRKKSFICALAVFNAIKICFSLAYLVKLTPFYYPWLYAHNVTLGRRETATQSSIQIFSLEGLMSLFPVAIFFIRVGQWWYESGHAKIKAMLEERSHFDSILKEKEPPSIVSPPNSVEMPVRGTCQLCKQVPYMQPTALPSGYVFCYICILHHLRQVGRCPITNICYSEADLRKIFQ